MKKGEKKIMKAEMRLDLGSIVVDLDSDFESDEIYFCADDLYGYYSLSQFRSLIKSLNDDLKKIEDFYAKCN